VRFLRLWYVHAYLDLLWSARSLGQILGFWLTDVVLKVAAVTATFLLAERFEGIGPWSRDQIVFMLGYAIVASGLVDVLFGYNVAYISRRVGRGQFDHTLVQPQPIWLSLLTEGFNPFSSSWSLLPGAVLMAWAWPRLHLAATPGWLILLGVSLAASALVLLAFSYLWGSLAFWAPYAAEEISMRAIDIMSALKPLPLDGAGPLLLGGLLTAIPAGFVAWFPCRVLLGIEPHPAAAFATPLAALLLACAAALLFLKGLQHYGRIGSQRYSTFGHRR
jgi:ABC-2 type transport system permease protein